VAGQRLRARLLIGLKAPDRARLEAVALGQPLFIFVSQGTDSTLLLQRDNRVLEHAPADAVLESVTGVPVKSNALQSLLTGCTTLADWRQARAPETIGGQCRRRWHGVPPTVRARPPWQPWRRPAAI
jgi:hypothetical protein